MPEFLTKPRRRLFVLWLLGLSILANAVALAAVELALRNWRPEEEQVVKRSAEHISVRDPRFGRALRPNSYLVVRHPEFSVRYDINGHGLRDRTPHPTPKPEGVTRILVVGDSFTFGVGNNYRDTWLVIAENRLGSLGHKVELVKAGVPGADTLDQTLRIERLLPKYQPDLVVLAFLPNDLVNNQLSLQARTEAKSRSHTSHEPFLHDYHVVRLAKRLLRSHDDVFVKLHLRTYQNRRAYISPAEEWFHRHAKITKKLLIKCLDMCRDRGAGFMVLSIPQEVQVLIEARGRAEPGLDVGMLDRRFRAFAGEAGFLWAPALPLLAETYRKKRERLYFRLDQHLNPTGNRVLGLWFAGLLSEIAPTLRGGDRTRGAAIGKL